jgi:hypothetical protein
MNVNDYNDPIAEAADEINRLREQLELKDQILKSVAKQGIEQKLLITELCDALERHQDLGMTDYDNHTAAIVRKDWKAITAEIDFDLITRAREATR